MTAEAVQAVGDPAPRTLPGRENWWVQPVTVAVGFSLFVLYSVWSVGYARHYHTGPYLSPFYSPVIPTSGWWPLSAAWLVAWAPLGFRATCYYYRKAYFRAFFWDPPACAIREPGFRHRYRGETRLPWILNNFHRFFLYLALVVLGFLWYDVVSAFDYNGGYLGIGAFVMLANVVLLTGYTFSCHALRHLVGGNINCYSCTRLGKQRHGIWRLVTKINPYHGTFAWFSLASVAAVDIYIRLVPGYLNCVGAHLGC